MAMTTPQSAYRTLLITTLVHFDLKDETDKTLAAMIIEEMWKQGDVRFIPLAILNEVQFRIPPDVLRAIRANLPRSGASTDPDAVARGRRASIYRELTDPMREVLMFRLAGVVTPGGYWPTEKGLIERGLLLKDRKNLTHLGTQIATGLSKRSLKKFARMVDCTYVPLIHPVPAPKSGRYLDPVVL